MKCVYLIIFKFILDVLYIEEIATRYWGYNGLDYNPNNLRYILAWIIYLLSFVFLKNFDNERWRYYKFSDYTVLFMFLFSYTPGLVMYGAGIFSTEYFICFIIMFILIFSIHYVCGVIKFTNYGKSVKVTAKRLNQCIKNYCLMVIVLVSIISICYVFLRYDFELFFHGFDKVYVQRSAFANIKLPSVLNYIMANVNMVNMIFIAYTIVKRNYKSTLVLLVVQFVYFSLSAPKIVLFANVIMLVIFMFNDSITLKKFLLYINCVVLFGTILASHNKLLMVASMLRRFLFLPNLLSYNYYDFFINSENKPIFLLINRDLYPSLVNIIADVYHNKPQMAANNGLVGDAVANFGLLGIMLFPIILSVFLQIADFLSKELDRKILVSISVIFFATLQNSFFSTSLLSHGFLIMLVLFYLSPSGVRTVRFDDESVIRKRS